MIFKQCVLLLLMPLKLKKCTHRYSAYPNSKYGSSCSTNSNPVSSGASNGSRHLTGVRHLPPWVPHTLGYSKVAFSSPGLMMHLSSTEGPMLVTWPLSRQLKMAESGTRISSVSFSARRAELTGHRGGGPQGFRSIQAGHLKSLTPRLLEVQ